MMMMLFTTISARVLWTCCQPLHHTMQNAAIDIVPMLYRDYGPHTSKQKQRLSEHLII